MFILRPGGRGHAVIPAAVPGQGVVLAVKTVGLFTVEFLHVAVGLVVVVGILRVSGVEVVLAAVARFKLQRLHRREVPAHHAVNIAVFHPFAARRQRIGVVARAVRLMTFVNIPRVRLGFIKAAVQAEAEIAAQRAVQAKVGAFGRAFVFVLRRVQVGVPGAMPLARAFFGDDIYHAARRAVAVAGRRRATKHFDTFNHLRRHPVGVASGVALAAPAQTHRVTAGDGLAVNQDQGVFRPHTANIDLAIIAALAAGGVAGQVDAGHGADDFRHVPGGGIFTDFIGGDGGNARRLQILLGGGNDDGVFVAGGLSRL